MRRNCRICRNEVNLVEFGSAFICAECLAVIKEFKIAKIPGIS